MKFYIHFLNEKESGIPNGKQFLNLEIPFAHSVDYTLN